MIINNQISKCRITVHKAIDTAPKEIIQDIHLGGNSMTFEEWYWRQDFGDKKREGLVSSLEDIANQAWQAGYDQGVDEMLKLQSMVRKLQSVKDQS